MISMFLFLMHFFKFLNDELNRVEGIRINFIINGSGILFMFRNPRPDKLLDIIFIHAQHTMIVLIIRLLIIRAHLLLLDIALNIFSF